MVCAAVEPAGCYNFKIINIMCVMFLLFGHHQLEKTWSRVELVNIVLHVTVVLKSSLRVCFKATVSIAGGGPVGCGTGSVSLRPSSLFCRVSEDLSAWGALRRTFGRTG